MKKSTPPTVTHKDCEVKLVVGPFGPHYAKLVCVQHNKFVAWAKQEIKND